MLLIFYSGRLSNLGQQGVIGGGEAGEETNRANEAASKLFKSNLLDIFILKQTLPRGAKRHD